MSVASTWIPEASTTDVVLRLRNDCFRQGWHVKSRAPSGQTKRQKNWFQILHRQLYGNWKKDKNMSTSVMFKRWVLTFIIIIEMDVNCLFSLLFFYLAKKGKVLLAMKTLFAFIPPLPLSLAATASQPRQCGKVGQAFFCYWDFLYTKFYVYKGMKLPNYPMWPGWQLSFGINVCKNELFLIKTLMINLTSVNLIAFTTS